MCPCFLLLLLDFFFPLPPASPASPSQKKTVRTYLLIITVHAPLLYTPFLPPTPALKPCLSSARIAFYVGMGLICCFVGQVGGGGMRSRSQPPVATRKGPHDETTDHTHALKTKTKKEAYAPGKKN